MRKNSCHRHRGMWHLNGRTRGRSQRAQRWRNCRRTIAATASTLPKVRFVSFSPKVRFVSFSRCRGCLLPHCSARRRDEALATTQFGRSRSQKEDARAHAHTLCILHCAITVPTHTIIACLHQSNSLLPPHHVSPSQLPVISAITLRRRAITLSIFANFPPGPPSNLSYWPVRIPGGHP